MKAEHHNWHTSRLPLDVLAWYYNKARGAKCVYVDGEYLMKSESRTLMAPHEWFAVRFPNTDFIPDECSSSAIRVSGGGGAWIATLPDGGQYHGETLRESVMRAVVAGKWGGSVPPPWEPTEEEIKAGAAIMPEIATRLIVGGQEQFEECAKLVFDMMSRAGEKDGNS